MSSPDITILLQRAEAGDAEAGEQVFAVVYEQLKQLARFQRLHWHRDDTLNATALVNEAWIKLSQGVGRDWQNQQHFFAVAARAMRQILVDKARSRQAVKRGGQWSSVDSDSTLEDTDGLSAEAAADVLALHETLNELQSHHPRQAQVVELHFFGGLPFSEISLVVGISLSTVRRDWELAKLWLHKVLTEGGT